MARSRLASSKPQGKARSKTRSTGGAVGTAEKLWGAIVKQGMLDLKSTSRRSAYDRAFEQEVATLMFPGASNPKKGLARQLKESGVGPEALLNAVMDASKPFTHMLSDIMEMLRAAQAPTTATSVDVEFDFDKTKPKYRATFEQFRATADRWEAVLIRQRQLSADWVWSVAGEGLGYSPLFDTDGPLASWLGSDSFDAPPPIPHSGQADFDAAAAALRDVVEIFLQYCRNLYPDRGAVGREQPKDDLLRAAHDRWHQTVTGRLAKLAEEIAVLPASEARRMSAKWAATIQTHLDELPETITSHERKVKDLLDLLRLPLWGKRAEMYSVWVAARLTKALGEQVKFHPVDGYLHFGFRATHIASICFQGHDLEYWTELRTPFTPTGKSKRKEAVQPDHSIVRATKSRGPDSVLCVECKHYAASSVANFAGAANDYAEACPDALIQLVSHGPMLPSVRAAIDTNVGARVELQGMFRGGDTAAITQFEQIMLDGLKARCPEASPTPAAVIEVRWDAPLVDVDLHVRIGVAHEEEIWFRNPGKLGAEPFVKLEQDVQTAPGVERIVIERWIPNTIYEVWVHDFTGTGVGLLSGSLELAIVIAGTRTVLKPTKRGYSARAWHAASIFPDHGGLQKVDGLMEKFEIPGLGVMQ